MAIRDLVPRVKGERAPARRTGGTSLLSFQEEMNRLFDDFFRGMGLPAAPEDLQLANAGVFHPRVNVAETDTEVEVTAELPGLDEKSVTVEVEEDALTLRGEKREEREEKGRNWRHIETSFGSFHRIVPLPAPVQTDKAQAKFRKGVLTVTAPKQKDAQRTRKTVAITSD